MHISVHIGIYVFLRSTEIKEYFFHLESDVEKLPRYVLYIKTKPTSE